MEKFKISIVIPFYYDFFTTSQCFDSVINQSYSNLEVIIVDTNHNELRETYIQQMFSHSNKKLKYLFMDNEGPGPARKLGCLNATGDFLLFLDDDDRLYDYYCIEACINLQKDNLNKNTAIINNLMMWLSNDTFTAPLLTNNSFQGAIFNTKYIQKLMSTFTTDAKKFDEDIIILNLYNALAQYYNWQTLSTLNILHVVIPTNVNSIMHTFRQVDLELDVIFGKLDSAFYYIDYHLLNLDVPQAIYLINFLFYFIPKQVYHLLLSQALINVPEHTLNILHNKLSKFIQLQPKISPYYSDELQQIIAKDIEINYPDLDTSITFEQFEEVYESWSKTLIE